MPVRLANWPNQINRLNQLTSLLIRYEEHSAQQRDEKRAV